MKKLLLAAILCGIASPLGASDMDNMNNQDPLMAQGDPQGMDPNAQSLAPMSTQAASPMNIPSDPAANAQMGGSGDQDAPVTPQVRKKTLQQIVAARMQFVKDEKAIRQQIKDLEAKRDAAATTNDKAAFKQAMQDLKKAYTAELNFYASRILPRHDSNMQQERTLSKQLKAAAAKNMASNGSDTSSNGSMTPSNSLDGDRN